MTAHSSKKRLEDLRDALAGRNRLVHASRAARMFDLTEDVFLKLVDEGHLPASISSVDEPMWRVGELEDSKARRRECHDQLIAGAHVPIPDLWKGNVAADRPQLFTAGFDRWRWLTRELDASRVQHSYQVTISLNHAYEHPTDSPGSIRRYNDRVAGDVEKLAKLLPRKFSKLAYGRRDLPEGLKYIIVGERFKKDRKTECPWHFHIVLFLTDEEERRPLPKPVPNLCSWVQRWAAEFSFITECQISKSDIGMVKYILKNSLNDERFIFVTNINA